MQITILGATGMVGKATLREALNKGYQVKVLVRSPEKLGDFKENVMIVKGNLLDALSVEQALNGSAAVINASGGVKEPDQFINFQKIGNILSEKMNELGMTRLVNISGAVMELPGENMNSRRKIMKVFVNLFFKQMVLAQKAILPIIIANKNIEWTFVRAAMISKKPGTGNILANDKQMQGTSITLDDLGKFMVEQIDSDQWVRKAPFVATK